MLVFSQLHTVFAKIDDDEKLTAFLIEADSEGITLNAEEKEDGDKRFVYSSDFL